MGATDMTTCNPDDLAGLPRIGTDEAGKGDYFGDLVVAGVFVDEAHEFLLRTIGVKDSKTLSDAKVKTLAKDIKALCPHNIVRISPAKYNDLYDKMGNLNTLLAWAHARVIENLLPRTKAGLVVADKFGDATLLQDALLKEGRGVRLVQLIRGERDLAVAAASILARATFLQRLDALSKEVGLPLPKGATHVIPVAKGIYANGGMALLREVAKVHFKTTEQVMKRVRE